MKKRVLVVESADKALKCMLSMLAANMIDNDLVSCPKSENSVELHGESYPIKLVWLERGDNDWVGCPCFACDFKGTLPTGDHVNAIVYVKAFALRSLSMCKMLMLTDRTEKNYREICDDTCFYMEGGVKGYPVEKYLYKNGKISLVP